MKDLNLVPNSIDALPLAAPQEVLSKASHGCFVIYKLYNLFFASQAFLELFLEDLFRFWRDVVMIQTLIGLVVLFLFEAESNILSKITRLALIMQPQLPSVRSFKICNTGAPGISENSLQPPVWDRFVVGLPLVEGSVLLIFDLRRVEETWEMDQCIWCLANLGCSMLLKVIQNLFFYLLGAEFVLIFSPRKPLLQGW